MRAHNVEGIVHFGADFARQVAAGDATVQVLLHGTDANTARIIEGYAQGAIATAQQRLAAEGIPVAGNGPVLMQSRIWFNEANDSHYFLVPGLIVLIITLIGAFLTALVMAREWERGTLEAIFVTPVHAIEILLGKIIPYFAMGMIGFALCVIAAEALFHVPLRGSLVVLTIVSMLYLLVSLGIGLVASSVTRSQFVSSQIALIATFLPAMLLSGFLFDIRSMPVAGSDRHLRPPGPLFRHPAADDLPRRRHLGRHPAERGGPRPDGDHPAHPRLPGDPQASRVRTSCSPPFSAFAA